MLLDLYQLFRTDEGSAHEFVERDDLKIDRRMAVARRVALSSEEIAIVLREDNDAGIAAIRKRIEATTTDPAAAAVIAASVERDIRAWLAAFPPTAWPGRPGPFAEHVSPAVIPAQDVDGTKYVPLTLAGWLFNPNLDHGSSYLVVRFYKSGSNNNNDAYVAEVLGIEPTLEPYRYNARVRVRLPGPGTYDLSIYQAADAGHPEYPTGGSRLAAAITVCNFEVTFPAP